MVSLPFFYFECYVTQVLMAYEVSCKLWESCILWECMWYVVYYVILNSTPCDN